MSPEEKSDVPEQSTPIGPAQSENNVRMKPELIGAEAPSSSLDQAVSPVSTPPKRRSQIIVMSVVVAALLVASGSFMWQQAHKPKPAEVFTGALTELMSSKTVTQSAGSSSLSQSVAYDTTNLKDPKVFVNVALKSNGLTNKLSGYGTLKNQYLKYTSFGSSAIDAKVPTLVNKWIQMRKDGKVLTDVDGESVGLVDPRVLMYGDLVTGNFSASDRQKLLSYIMANKVYKYDVKHVTTSTVNGDKVYVYPVTENIPKLKELNRKVAVIMGLSPADIKAALDNLGTAGTTKLYINMNNKQVVKYTTSQDGQNITGAYTDYDTTSLPAEPKADMTWDEFVQEESKVLTGLGSGASAASTGTDNSAQQQI